LPALLAEVDWRYCLGLDMELYGVRLWVAAFGAFSLLAVLQTLVNVLTGVGIALGRSKLRTLYACTFPALAAGRMYVLAWEGDVGANVLWGREAVALAVYCTIVTTLYSPAARKWLAASHDAAGRTLVSGEKGRRRLALALLPLPVLLGWVSVWLACEPEEGIVIAAVPIGLLSGVLMLVLAWRLFSPRAATFSAQGAAEAPSQPAPLALAIGRGVLAIQGIALGSSAAVLGVVSRQISGRYEMTAGCAVAMVESYLALLLAIGIGRRRRGLRRLYALAMPLLIALDYALYVEASESSGNVLFSFWPLAAGILVYAAALLASYSPATTDWLVAPGRSQRDGAPTRSSSGAPFFAAPLVAYVVWLAGALVLPEDAHPTAVLVVSAVGILSLLLWVIVVRSVFRSPTRTGAAGRKLRETSSASDGESVARMLRELDRR